MSYREIRGILEDDELFDAARYDEEAGVYYVTYGEGTGDSWVSFDDSVSFQAKVDLANSRGLGGLFIWAVDQDNDNLDALRAVSQRDVVVPPLVSSLKVEKGGHRSRSHYSQQNANQPPRAGLGHIRCIRS